MKTSTDPRHINRQKTIQELFEWSFRQKGLKTPQTLKLIKQISKIDNIIKVSAPLWPLEQISKIDLAILRLSIYELVLEKVNPPKVIIDEAIELAKEFGGDKSSKFINGVLGTVVKSYQSQTIKNDSN